MKYGVLLSTLRKSRKISQFDLSAGITSQSALSRFESGGEVYAHNLILYLKKLNVHPTEFFMLAEDTDFIARQNFNHRLQSGFTSQIDCEILVNEERDRYTQTGNILNLINAVHVEVVYAKMHDLPLTNYQKDLKKVKQYLLSIDTWMIFEVTLYLDLLFIFDDSFIEHQHHRMSQSLQSLPFETELRQGLSAAYANNLIVLDFERNNLLSLSKHINYFESILSKNPRNLISSIQIDFYNKMFNLKKYYSDAEVIDALETLIILKKYHYEETYDDLKNFLFENIHVPQYIKIHY